MTADSTLSRQQICRVYHHILLTTKIGLRRRMTEPVLRVHRTVNVKRNYVDVRTAPYVYNDDKNEVLPHWYWRVD